MSARQLGNRLRAAREARGMVLQEVEARSAREFKASVLGAYERGDRTISAPRLVRLAEFYGMSPEELISSPEPVDIDLRTEEAAAAAETAAAFESVVPLSRSGTMIDVSLPDHSFGDDHVVQMVTNFIDDVRSSRESRSAYELRESDVQLLAAATGTKPSVIRDLVREVAMMHRKPGRARPV